MKNHQNGFQRRSPRHQRRLQIYFGQQSFEYFPHLTKIICQTTKILILEFFQKVVTPQPPPPPIFYGATYPKINFSVIFGILCSMWKFGFFSTSSRLICIAPSGFRQRGPPCHTLGKFKYRTIFYFYIETSR